MGSFFGLEIARSALFSSQTAIEVTGHNIANADSAGYTVQRVFSSAIGSISGNSRFLPLTKGLTGGGVGIADIEQVRNIYLDSQYRNENSKKAQWDCKADGLAMIEQIFDEASDYSLSGAFSRFIAAVNELSKNPQDIEQRINLYQNGNNLAKTFNRYHSVLKNMMNENNKEVKDIVTEINDIAKNIAELNRQIALYEKGRGKANDLRDKRNMLLDKLSGLINYTYRENNDGSLTIQIGNKVLVDNIQVNYLEAQSSAYNPLTGANDLYAVVWSDDGSGVEVTSGRLKGCLDLRDSTDGSNIGIVHIVDTLNTLADSFARTFNEIHRSGYTIPHDSNGNISQNGINFFDESGEITAENIAISAEIIESVYNIAASSQQVTGDSLEGNNVIALQLAALFDKTDIPVIGNVNDFFGGLIMEIATQASLAYSMQEGQTAFVESIEHQRMSVSGVSLDEEMAKLVKYQHSYAAAARLITVIDEALDILINKTGLVGR